MEHQWGILCLVLLQTYFQVNLKLVLLTMLLNVSLKHGNADVDDVFAILKKRKTFKIFTNLFITLYLTVNFTFKIRSKTIIIS